MATVKKGVFITFEGGEAVGKSTQIRLLERWLKSHKIAFITTREPGGSQLGKKLRALLLSSKTKSLSPRAEVLLYMADRAQHVEEKLLKALAARKVVISDRFADSSLVYQGIARNLGEKNIDFLNQFATQKLTPHVTFLLDLPLKVANQRLRQRSGKKDRIESEKQAFHAKVRNGFLKLARKNRRFVVLKAEQSAEKIQAQIQTHLKRWIKLR